MPYTREQLVTAIGEELNVASDGQPTEAEDAGIIRRLLPSVLADLALRNIVVVPDAEAIADGVYNHLSVIVAAEIADKFMLSTEAKTLLAARAQAADGKLRNQRARTVPSAPLRMSCI